MSNSHEKAASRSALLLAFATIYLVWGSTYLGIHVAVESMPPFLMASARFSIAGGLLFLFVRLRGVPWPKQHHWRDAAISGSCLLLGGNGLVSWAEQYIPSGIAALIIGIGPVFTVLTEWAWPGGRRPSVVTFGGLLLGFVGVAWLAAPWENTSHGGLHVGGLIALVIACASWSFGSIYARNVRQAAPPLLAAALQMLCGSAALCLVAGLRGEVRSFDFHAVTANSWWAFIYLIFVGSLIGYSTFSWLLKNSTPALVSTYAYVNPIVAVVLGWLILREPFSPRTAIASCFIVAAVVIITTAQKRRAAKTA